MYNISFKRIMTSKKKTLWWKKWETKIVSFVKINNYKVDVLFSDIYSENLNLKQTFFESLI